MLKPRNGDVRPCLLLRVSTDEQRMDQQEREARAYCLKEYEVEVPESAVFREHGVSGSQNTFEQRDALKRAVEACERGEFTHFIVHNISRSARRMKVFAEVWERLEKAGVHFVAIQDGIDSEHGDSSVNAYIYGIFADHFSRQLSKEVKKGKRGVINAGRSNGKPPYGYRTEGKDRIPDLREIEGHPGVTRVDIVRRIFAEASAGWNIAEITDHLNRDGFVMESIDFGVGPFRRCGVGGMLRNRFYLGEISDHPKSSRQVSWLPGVHEPIITVDVFDYAQQRLAEHALHPRTIPLKHTYDWLFGGGLLQCCACRDRGGYRSMSYHATTRPNQKNPFAYYACGNRIRSGLCEAPHIREDRIAAQVAEYLDRWQADPEIIDRSIVQYKARCEATDQASIAETQRKQLQGKIKRLADAYVAGGIEYADYLQQNAELKRQLLAIAVNNPQRISDEVLAQISETMKHIKTAWEMASNKQKGEMARMLFRAIWIREGKIERIEPQSSYRMFFGEDGV
jgi:site-specific DNA recombinase